jgi:hypothetical protein
LGIRVKRIAALTTFGDNFKMIRLLDFWALQTGKYKQSAIHQTQA